MKNRNTITPTYGDVEFQRIKFNNMCSRLLGLINEYQQLVSFIESYDIHSMRIVKNVKNSQKNITKLTEIANSMKENEECFEEIKKLYLTVDYPKQTINSKICNFDKKIFEWDEQQMRSSDIVKFEVSFGDFPIHGFSFAENVLQYQRKINGSRDGGRHYPEGYFDKQQIFLNVEQLYELKHCLSKMEFHTWKTEREIFDKIGACGFCLNETFMCEFKNGRIFRCYSLRGRQDFIEFTNLLQRLCGIK